MSNTRIPAPLTTAKTKKCAREGCNRNVFVDSNGQKSRFCSQACLNASHCRRPSCPLPQGKYEYCSKNCRRSHLNAAAKTCATPGCTNVAYVDPLSPTIQYDYCSVKCYHAHSNHVQTTELVFLSRTNSDFELVQKHVNAAFPIKAVARIIYPSSRTSTHLQMGMSCSRVFRFHGTTLQCNIRISRSVCNLPGCSVCGILKFGFLDSFLRDRRGHYCAKDAKTSTGYGQPNAQNDRAMFFCNVFDPNNAPISILSNRWCILPRFLVIY